MNSNPVYVLIHSPLVGELTWSLVAEQIPQHGQSVVIPVLSDSANAKDPYWKQHAQSVAQALVPIPQDTKVILVAHSGAGPLLPAIREHLPNPIRAYVFVDAGIPHDGATRLDLMKSEDPEWVRQFEESLKHGERFPAWSRDDLREIVPNESVRERLVAELHPRGLDFFTEPIPVFERWPDAPCIYIQFSAPYDKPADQARRSGWDTYKLAAGHFHMLVDAKAVTEMIINAINNQP
jgi:pimeloyl-ACP methyl ester carboxylesterase